MVTETGVETGHAHLVVRGTRSDDGGASTLSEVSLVSRANDIIDEHRKIR
jgi:hypothetical protein